MKFDQYDIADEIKKSLDELGFLRPTDIQYKSIPAIMRGEDVLAVAQTGTGKTAAFAIPIIDQAHELRVRRRGYQGLKCIVLVPTHELAIQVAGVFKAVARHTKVKIAAILGGVDQDPQIAQLKKGVDIVVTTPGRMFDLISQGYLKVEKVETLILDEADHMLDLGFIDDIRDLNKKIPKRRQTLFFSATINKKIKKLAYSLIKQSAIRISISPKDPVSKNVDHHMAFIEMDDKRFFLERVVNENPESKILVFVRTKVRAERVHKAMARVKIESITIHSDKTQKQRNDVMSQFRKGEVKMLIATDVSARGIDIPDVDLVINYDLPDKAENYVHRVGRTGRGKKRGTAYSFCAPQEAETLEEIQTYVGKPIKRLDIEKSEYENTLLFSEGRDDLQKLLGEALEMEDNYKNRKKKKHKKKK